MTSENEASSPALPAGWYVNPDNAAELRWWTGQEWTASTRPLEPPAAQPPPPSDLDASSAAAGER